MSAVELATQKLQQLSPDRMRRAVEYIEDLAELEAMENEIDAREARKALQEPGENITLDQLETELGLKR